MLNHLDIFTHLRGRRWRIVWLIVAFAYAMPLAWWAYQRVGEVTREARWRLITEYRLWELHPEYHGTPETWTRFAVRLLSDHQILLRVERKYGELGVQIALDYRRDLAIAQAEVVVTAVAAWLAPVALCYGAGMLWARRPPPVPERPQPASVSDARYRE